MNKKILTGETTDRYIRDGKWLCPFCDHTGLHQDGEVYYVDNKLAINMRCDKCGEAWRETYKLFEIMHENFNEELGKWEIEIFEV